jgi:hypothetical protein
LKSVDLAFTSLSGVTIHWDLVDPDLFLTQIRHLIELAPDTIETFPRAIPPIPGLTPQKVATAFSHAAKIKNIHLSEKLIDLHGSAEEWCYTLASDCSALEEVDIEVEWSQELRRYTILRDGLGRAIRIGQIEESPRVF